MKIISVVGARPNFIKIAPFIKAINNYNLKCEKRTEVKPGPTKSKTEHIDHILVHTGQHYDDRMSKAFFDDLDIKDADINLDIGSGTHAEQIGQTMIAFEKVVKAEKPDWVVVVGDVNATIACSVIAKKEWVRCCHIEAGLRSGDNKMPEEINRIVTDRLSDLLLTPDKISSDNLRHEGTPEENIVFVGNIMIDTLESTRSKAEAKTINDIINRNRLNYKRHKQANPFDEKYALMTIHRPSNVDNEEVLKPIIRMIMDEVAKEMTVIWPLHPRAKKQLIKFGLYEEVIKHSNIIILEPIGYLDMLRLNMGARILLTDSGGLQEESTILGTPCITLRWNTERPVTLREHGGVSVLVGNKVNNIRAEFLSALHKPRMPVRPELWDGRTAERCLKAILEYGNQNIGRMSEM